MLVPIVTYATEMWVMTVTDIDKVESLQKLIARRCQRFSNWSPSATSYACLGWIRLETYINLKKLLFIRTIAQMDENAVYP